ncbi:hypothetical protein GHT09_002959 [Marmota monax]|uniref:Uncharacterized protein n=1 Tax=Marmota monax TaxID=9995 RepID=A0A834V6J1_MARMO|nr:hypothetical protein GHT09_002959 [Marmota monax]
MYIAPLLVSSFGTGLDTRPLPGQRQGQASRSPSPTHVLPALARSLCFADPPPGQKQDRGLLRTPRPHHLFYPRPLGPRGCICSLTRLRGRSPWVSSFVLRAFCSTGPHLGHSSLVPPSCGFSVLWRRILTWCDFSRWSSSLEDIAGSRTEARVSWWGMEWWPVAFRWAWDVTARAVWPAAAYSHSGAQPREG